MAVSTGRGRVGPIRAVLVARFQTSWNRSTKELGKNGRVALVILVALIALAIVPIYALLGAIGQLIGSTALSPVKGPLVLDIGAFLLGLLGVGGGVIGGALGGAQQLRWESYRVFPLRAAQLFVAELASGLGDVLNLGLALAIAAVLVGFGIGRPVSWPFLPLVWLAAVSLILTIQLLIGAVAEILTRRLRVGLAVVGGLVWVGSALAHRVAMELKDVDSATAARIDVVVLWLQRALWTLPTTWSVRGLHDVAIGDPVRGVGFLLAPALVILPLAWAAARLMLREQESLSVPAAPGRSVGKLWSFRSPAFGVARLQWETLFASSRGRFVLVVPVVTIVLLKGPFANALIGASWAAVPTAFSYVALSGNQLLFNQFGLDGAAVKGLYLLPISTRDLMRGKVLGFAAYTGLRDGLLLAMLALLRQAPPSALLAGALLSACYFHAGHTIGCYMSAAQPRLVQRKRMSGNALPLAAAMLNLGVGLACIACFGGTFALLAWMFPDWLLPGMAALCAATWGVARLFRPALEAYWTQRREAIVEAMG